MGGCAVNDKDVPFLDKRFLGIDDMGGMTMQNDNEFGEINMVMHVHVLFVSAVLNKELKLLIPRKPIQMYASHSATSQVYQTVT